MNVVGLRMISGCKCLAVVCGNLWRWLLLEFLKPLLWPTEHLVDLSYHLPIVVEGDRHIGSRFTEGIVLGLSRLLVRICLGTGMAELNACGKHRRAGSCNPCDQRLGDLAVFQGLV